MNATQAISTTLPDVTTASGSLARIVNWVGDAWNELQCEYSDWDWMRSSNILGAGVSFVPGPGQATTPLGTGAGQLGIATDSFGKWDRETFRNFTTATGQASDEIQMEEIDFDRWRDSYMIGPLRQTQTRPYVIAVGPDQSLNVGPPPNGNYTVTGDYFMAPSLMAVNSDVPLGLPLRFHLLIVYRAMLKYSAYESAPEVFSRGTTEGGKLFNRLEAARAPGMSWAGALA